MKAHFHGKCVHVVFMWTHVEYEILWPMDLLQMKPKYVNCVTQHISVISPKTTSSSMCNSRTVCVGWCSTEAAPKEIIKGIHFQWTWWPQSHTYKVLWKLIRQDMATKRIMLDIQDDIHCMWVCIILLQKCCVHMPYSLNDWNDVILQLLQVQLLCYGALHKDWSSKPLLAECTPFCRMEWCLREYVWIFWGPAPCVLLDHESIKVEMGFSIKP